MKKLLYIFPLTALLFFLGACKKDDTPDDKVPQLSLLSSYTDFDGTIASVELRLSHFIHSDVVVHLKVDGIEQEALSFDPEVTILAGAIRKVVPITIKPKLVELHKDYQLNVKVESADGATLGQATSVSLGARIDEVRNWEFEPVFHSEWNVYAYAYSGFVYMYMYAAPKYYEMDIFPASEGDLSDPSFLLKRMDAFADAINARYEQYKDRVSAKTDVVCNWSGSADYAYWLLDGEEYYLGVGDPGRYNILMMEFDADLVPTGAYKSDAFTFNP